MRQFDRSISYHWHQACRCSILEPPPIPCRDSLYPRMVSGITGPFPIALDCNHKGQVPPCSVGHSHLDQDSLPRLHCSVLALCNILDAVAQTPHVCMFVWPITDTLLCASCYPDSPSNLQGYLASRGLSRFPLSLFTGSYRESRAVKFPLCLLLVPPLAG